VRQLESVPTGVSEDQLESKTFSLRQTEARAFAGQQRPWPIVPGAAAGSGLVEDELGRAGEQRPLGFADLARPKRDGRGLRPGRKLLKPKLRTRRKETSGSGFDRFRREAAAAVFQKTKQLRGWGGDELSFPRKKREPGVGFRKNGVPRLAGNDGSVLLHLQKTLHTAEPFCRPGTVAQGREARRCGRP